MLNNMVVCTILLICINGIGIKIKIKIKLIRKINGCCFNFTLKRLVWGMR